jgi:hypothetical protein
MSDASNIDKPYIEERANKWIEKVDNLYKIVKDALKNDTEIECRTDNNIVMYEELMNQFGVLPKNVPIFDIYIRKQLIATFKPIGLWVTGAAGRIDILTKKGSYILVDMSENESTPLWKVFTPQNRKKGESFDEEFISKLVHSK